MSLIFIMVADNIAGGPSPPWMGLCVIALALASSCVRGLIGGNETDRLGPKSDRMATAGRAMRSGTATLGQGKAFRRAVTETLATRGPRSIYFGEKHNAGSNCRGGAVPIVS